MYKKIQSILNSQLALMTDLPTVVWENTVVEIGEGEIYIEPRLFPSDNFYPFLGENVAVNFSGIYQINIVAPKGVGWGQSVDLVDKLSAHFPRGLVLSDGDMNIKIKQVDVAPGIQNPDGTYVIPVSIYYFGYYK